VSVWRVTFWALLIAAPVLFLIWLG
jgi:hypothetical protein